MSTHGKISALCHTCLMKTMKPQLKSLNLNLIQFFWLGLILQGIISLQTVSAEPQLTAKQLLAKIQLSIENEKPSQAVPFIEELLTTAKKSEDAHLIGQSYSASAKIKSMLGDYHSASIYFTHAINRLAQDKKQLAIAYLGRGAAQEHLANYSAALLDYEASLELNQHIGDQSSIARSLNNLGNIYGKYTIYDKALEYYQQGLAIKKKLNEPGGIGGALNNIGNIYSKIEQPEKALEFYQDALPYMQQADRKLFVEIILGNIGAMHRRLGQPQKAIDYILQSLKIAEEIDDKQGIAIGAHNIAQAYSDLDNKSAAKTYYKKALLIERSIGDRRSEGDTLVNLASIYLKEKEVELAKTILDQAEAIAEEIEDQAILESIALQNTAIYEFQGDTASALSSLKKYNQIKSVRDSKNLDERVAQLKSSYDFDKETQARKQEIDALKINQKQQQLSIDKNRYFRYLLLAIGMVLATSLAFFYYALNRERKYAKRLKKMSFQDPLTRLGNRRSLSVTLKTTIPDVHRCYNHHRATSMDADNRDLIFLLIDLDHFKQVNDTYGHHAGDAVLKSIKNIIQPLMRDTDPIIRWGGEEFLIVARNSKRVLAHQIAERIRQKIEQFEFEVGQKKPLKLSCSIGFACYPFFQNHPVDISWEQVVSIADKALYYSKQHGRNAWSGFIATETWFSEAPEKDINKDYVGLLEMKAIELQTSTDNPHIETKQTRELC
jgi:two-component system, cell cycle response regulator